MNQTVHNFTQQSNFVQTIIRVMLNGMIRTQQYPISTIRQHEWLSGVAEGPRGRIYGKSTTLWVLKIREKIIESYSSFTH